MKPYLLIIFLIALISCKDEPSSPQYNPCEGKHPVSADFDLYQKNYTKEVYVSDGDTVLAGWYLMMRAKYDCDYYEWNLEGDTTKYYEKNTYVRFKGNEYKTIRVRLIVKSVKNTACFPNDDGIDTVYKSITVKPIWTMGLFGYFRGVNLGAPLDTFNVHIKLTNLYNEYYVQLINFPKGSNDSLSTELGSIWYLELFYNKMYILHGGTLPLPEGWFYFDPKTNKLRIEYSLTDSTDHYYYNRKNYIFEGIKVGDEK